MSHIRNEARETLTYLVRQYPTITTAMAAASMLKDADGKRDARDMSDDDYLETVLGVGYGICDALDAASRSAHAEGQS